VTCATARTLPGRNAACEPVKRPAALFSAGAKSAVPARRAGARPNRMPVSTDTAAVNPRIRRLGLRSSTTGTRPDDIQATRTRIDHRASRMPPAPPATASMRLSTRSCRIRRRRPAPSASLNANSGRRAAERASSRLAVLTQAISKTTATIVITTTNGCENCRRSSLNEDAGLRVTPGGLPGSRGAFEALLCSNALKTLWACAWPTPGFNRASVCTQVRLTIGISSRFSKAGMTVGCIMIGRNMSGDEPTSTPKKPGGVTPMIVNGAPERVIVLPMTDPSPAKRRFQ